MVATGDIAMSVLPALSSTDQAPIFRSSDPESLASSPSIADRGHMPVPSPTSAVSKVSSSIGVSSSVEIVKTAVPIASTQTSCDLRLISQVDPCPDTLEAEVSAVVEAVLLEVEAELLAFEQETRDSHKVRELSSKSTMQAPSFLMLISIIAAMALIAASFAVPARVLYSQIYNSDATTQRGWIVTAFVTVFVGCLLMTLLIVAICVVIELIVRPRTDYTAPLVEVF